ncbi:hypothetical protein PHYSODRAFT_339825 [Phytophthora sojae]|uniref:Uncharacterized protein n=1 Tax=Phytophthora sojae (strain P6497) TaxID=1094619 RepID=G5A7R3_PHYSP|nr:hypothetical protein PHYSODRAFT_339825 [Phytophthora sojae]EGZ07939.1 hypothetical protein PHYSODRAFT_339825 [Phytophthora sojae]|eukprot:XP_009536111.1 hypothetical protein PHYSODRAFT_339825 [Phytophthora sojae]
MGGGRWDWTRLGDVHHSPARLGDHAAARYRCFRQTIEAIPHVNETLFGLLLAVESAREELQPFEVAPPLVQLAGTSTAVQQVRRLHRVLDEAVAMAGDGVLEAMSEGKWSGALQAERSARIKWYWTMLEEKTRFDSETKTSVQQEEVLTLLKAAVDEDKVKRELIPGEIALMETVFDLVLLRKTFLLRLLVFFQR